MTDTATRIRVHGGRVVHAVTAYPGGRLRTECFYDLGVGDVSRHGHSALPANTAVTCRACQKQLAREEAAAGGGEPAAGRIEPPMRPEDVPEDIWQIARHAYADIDWPDGRVAVSDFRNPWTALREALAAVIPAIRAAAIADHYAELTARAEAAQTENRARHQRITRGDQ